MRKRFFRTQLQALYALFDNANSLHTNAYDEAITTPIPESVRRAVAIQMDTLHQRSKIQEESLYCES